jgi:5-bromo-4-chloroindolyl phosphate hydrolysis protein
VDGRSRYNKTMKKFMVADLVKDTMGLSQSEYDYLRENWDESEWQVRKL